MYLYTLMCRPSKCQIIVHKIKDCKTIMCVILWRFAKLILIPNHDPKIQILIPDDSFCKIIWYKTCLNSVHFPFLHYPEISDILISSCETNLNLGRGQRPMIWLANRLISARCSCAERIMRVWNAIATSAQRRIRIQEARVKLTKSTGSSFVRKIMRVWNEILTLA